MFTIKEFTLYILIFWKVIWFIICKNYEKQCWHEFYMLLSLLLVDGVEPFIFKPEILKKYWLIFKSRGAALISHAQKQLIK